MGSHMNVEQDRNAFKTADTIADHLVYAWNYHATLRALQRHARETADVLDAHGHFISTVTYAIWDALFLEIAHCSDRRKEAMGFPTLFKQLRVYLPEDHGLRGSVDQQERAIASLHARQKLENWRNQMVAHHTTIGESSKFYTRNVCSLDEIEALIRAFNKILHSLSIKMWNQAFCVEDLGSRASQGVDRLVEMMKRGGQSDPVR